jgi:metal-responsive CopG/Arc/MetJ family transcriptional regulator
MKKEKFSISMDLELLAALEGVTIDRRLSSRSHAIDVLLRENPTIREEIALAKTEPRGIPLAVHRRTAAKAHRHGKIADAEMAAK